jgi:hypothetical protein
MKCGGICKTDPLLVFGIVAVIIRGSILSTVSVFHEADAVIRKNTKKTVCVAGVCTTNETIVGDCPNSQCRSENSVTIK